MAGEKVARILEEYDCTLSTVLVLSNAHKLKNIHSPKARLLMMLFLMTDCIVSLAISSKLVRINIGSRSWIMRQIYRLCAVSGAIRDMMTTLNDLCEIKGKLIFYMKQRITSEIVCKIHPLLHVPVEVSKEFIARF